MKTVNVSLEAECANLHAVIEYEHPSLVRRLQNKCGLEEDNAKRLFDDTKRFLYLCAESAIPLVPPPAIDECWHHFLLFTFDYAKFCQRYFGAFIHHRPRYIDDPPSRQADLLTTVAAAKRKFGEVSGNWDYSSHQKSNCDSCVSCWG